MPGCLSARRRRGAFLRSLNANKTYLEKRRLSRHRHERVVSSLVSTLRGRGRRCYVLSEYVKEKRTPDAIVFDGAKLIAIEVEQEKRYKPSNASLRERLVGLNGLSGFFDRTEVIFVPTEATVDEAVEDALAGLLSKD